MKGFKNNKINILLILIYVYFSEVFIFCFLQAHQNFLKYIL